MAGSGLAETKSLHVPAAYGEPPDGCHATSRARRGGLRSVVRAGNLWGILGQNNRRFCTFTGVSIFGVTRPQSLYLPCFYGVPRDLGGGVTDGTRTRRATIEESCLS